MNKVYCLVCDRSIPVREKMEIGNEIVCPHCEATFELVGVTPLEIEPVFQDSYQGRDEWLEYEDEWLYDEEEDQWSWRIAKKGRLQAYGEERRRVHVDRE